MNLNQVTDAFFNIDDVLVDLVTEEANPTEDIPWPRDITITLTRDSNIVDLGNDVEIGIEYPEQVSAVTGLPYYEKSGILLNKADNNGTFELKNIHESNKIKIMAADTDTVYIKEM